MRRSRVVLLVLLVAVVAFLWFAPRGPDVEQGTVLVLTLEGEYVEAAEPSLLARLLGDRRRPFASVLSELRKAEVDDRLAAVVLRVRALEVGWGQAHELREAVASLGAAGRETLAVLEVESFAGNLEYYVASAAGEVIQSPASRGPLVGLAAEYFFLGGLFEKLGIDLEVERIGRYKTAADVIAGREMSEAHREMADSLLDSVNGDFVAALASSRGVSPDFVRRAIDEGPSAPEEMKALGLVDAVATVKEVVERFGEDAPVMEGAEYAAVDPAGLGIEPAARFALVYGSGNVLMGRGRSGPTGDPILAADTVADALLQAAEDPEIDAVLFRVNSPGGSALASDIVWRATQEVMAKKPLVASFSDVAASGGYYVACGADAIVASPGTLTGSIGVVTLRPVVQDLLEKLDVGSAALTRGRHADLLVATRPLPEGARRVLAQQARSVYDLFVARVAAGRELSAEQVDELGRGRVWTGAQAAERGLVDGLGGLRVAADRAKERLGIDPEADVVLVPFPPPKTLMDQLGEALQRSVRAAVPEAALPPGAALPPVAARLLDWLRTLPYGEPALVPPLLVEIR